MNEARQEPLKTCGWTIRPFSRRKAFCNALQTFFNGIPCQHAFSNEAQGDRESVFAAGGLEEIASNESEDGWYRLASFRDYKHPKGLQRITEAAANTMANVFHGAVARVKRLFTGDAGLPIFRGHPDDSEFADKYSDNTVYGRVDDMQTRPDGFYGHISWANEWAKLKAEGRWRFSPRWTMQPVADGIFSPRRLVSIGLTPTPNLPDAAFANEQNTETMDLLKILLAKLGFAQDRVDATVSGGENAIKPDEVDAAMKKLTTDATTNAAAAKADAQKAKADLAAANSRITTLETEKATAEEIASNERKARAAMAVDEAIASGRITAAERPGWEKKLAETKDWPTVANELATSEIKVHSARQFGDQGARRQTADTITASNEFRTLVDEHMAKTHCDFDRAWSNVSGTEQGKALLKRMEAPAE